MKNQSFDRTALLVGKEAMARIQDARVIVFGIGGVGSWVAECLVRTGVRHITLVDSDRVAETNINRQMPATTTTVGEVKTEAARRRLLEINPEAEVRTLTIFYDAETAEQIDLTEYDYIVDAIDSLKDKALLILNATRSGKKLYSSMGAALKMDPAKVKVGEFWSVKGCPLARALRQRFKKNKEYPSRKFTCVYSDELLENKGTTQETCGYKARINGSLCHITAIFGMTLAGEIIMDICHN
ncbi:MAG: tRNA threonylcarbamoyladenosine dehydratase [Muribaculaceae bacterium]|nr:tRNA threonylcarbamoyladenosine dehydratase [Muribaculaceae bacterium]MDE6552843.1 tRNA threonylcarbamoyladenosine dehydratase [Muribaculaceae bacterium]